MSPIPSTRPLRNSVVIGARIVTSLPPCSECAHAKWLTAAVFAVNAIATGRLAAINRAYERIEAERA